MRLILQYAAAVHQCRLDPFQCFKCTCCFICIAFLKLLIDLRINFLLYHFTHGTVCRMGNKSIICRKTPFLIYCLAGYWAVNRTIYANYVLYGDLATIFMRKVIVGMLAGPVCIPLAIIKTVAGKKGGDE